MAKRFSSFYSEDHINAVARESGFMKRNRKLQPSHFLDSLMFNVHDNRSASLNDQSLTIQLRQGSLIRKQSLDERFNAGSVAFVKSLLEKQLKTQVAAHLESVCFKRFRSVKIKDSTRFQLPASLQHAYPGSGGAASCAGMHVQFEFDLKGGTVSTIKATDAKRQDSTDAQETVSDIEEGSLVIRDLGYFSSKVLREIDTRRKAFYITRMVPGLKVYRRISGKFIALDLQRELVAMKSSCIGHQELEVYLESNLKYPVRLMMERLSDEEVERRMRRARENARKKGRNLRKVYQAYAALGLFLTNVPKDWLKTEHIRTVYRLRWQIELRFKGWKGLCRVNAVKKVKLHRFETNLYARLLYILVHWEISQALVSEHWKKTRTLLSVYKCYKTLMQCSDLLRDALFTGSRLLKDYFTLIKRLNSENLKLEKRQNHLALYEILLTKIHKKVYR